MKLNLLATSLLLGAALGLTVNEVKNMKNAVDVKKAYGTNKAVVIAAFPHLKAKQCANFDAAEIGQIVTEKHAELMHLHMIPAKFFKNRDDVNSVYDLLVNGGGPKTDFFAMLTPEQFKNYVADAAKGDFHDDFTVDFLNALVGKRAKKYAAVVSFKFLDHVFDGAPERLEKEIVKNLPVKFLTQIKNAPNKADGEHWTKLQLGALKEGYQAALDFSEVPKAHFKLVENRKVLVKIASDNKLTSEQMSGFSGTQWNALFAKKDGCVLVPEGTKIRDASNVKINDKCFVGLPADVQSYYMIHGNPVHNILSRVTNTMSDAWSHKDASGLEILKYLKDKSLIRELGTHEDVTESTHPVTGLDIDAVKAIKVLHENLNGQMIEAMSLEAPQNMEELRKNAEFYCGLDDIFSTIQDLADEKADKKKNRNKPSFWSVLPVDLATKLFGPTYSKLAGDLTKEVFALLSEEVKADLPAHAVAAFKFLKDMDKEAYAKLGESAFADISAEHVGVFRLADVTDAQFPHVSVAAKESFFGKVTAEELAKESARFNKLVADQVAALPVKTFQAVMTKETMPQLSAEAVKKITAVQLKSVPVAVLATITEAQIATLGLDVAEAKDSGLAVLLANQNVLSTGAKAALALRLPCDSAVRSTLSAGVVAAVAAVALLL